MAEPLDIYADVFHVSVNPWGVNMTFGLRDPHPRSGELKEDVNLCTVRMGHAHFKVMAFMLHRQMTTYERDGEVQGDLPSNVLRALNIDVAEWDKFWEHRDRSAK